MTQTTKRCCCVEIEDEDQSQCKKRQKTEDLRVSDDESTDDEDDDRHLCVIKFPRSLKCYADDISDQFEGFEEEFYGSFLADLQSDGGGDLEIKTVGDSQGALDCFKNFIGSDALDDSLFPSLSKEYKLNKYEHAFVKAVLNGINDDHGESARTDFEQLVDEDDDDEFRSRGVRTCCVDGMVDMAYYKRCARWAKTPEWPESN